MRPRSQGMPRQIACSIQISGISKRTVRSVATSAVEQAWIEEIDDLG
jgi:hypothetical protein